MKQQTVKRLEKLEVVTGIRDQITELIIQGVSRNEKGKLIITSSTRLKIGGGREELPLSYSDNEGNHEET